MFHSTRIFRVLVRATLCLISLMDDINIYAVESCDQYLLKRNSYTTDRPTERPTSSLPFLYTIASEQAVLVAKNAEYISCPCSLNVGFLNATLLRRKRRFSVSAEN